MSISHNSAISETLASQYARARKSRDARFDGLFFVAVKTTGIYCRPICPATPALEHNVQYFVSAIGAAQQGFRPCMRCRPDSSPNSFAWLGTETTFRRALSLIQSGALSDISVPQLAERLGVSDRYLRKLFNQQMGVSPKQYALYQQCLFAKKLLQETQLAVQEVAFAAGFNSVRRFNDTIKQQLALTPGDLRKASSASESGITLRLSYRPPYNTTLLLNFLGPRVISGIEASDERGYTRSIVVNTGKQSVRGYFSIKPVVDEHQFEVFIQLEQTDVLYAVVQRIRTIFDLDAPITEIDQSLSAAFGDAITVKSGLRVPGIWDSFEAGIRAILGQQVTVNAAKNLLILLVENLGELMPSGPKGISHYFPSPQAILASDLSFFGMPQSRKDTMHRLAQHFIDSPDPEDIDKWLDIKGIGPWTVNYVKMRATKDPDIWLAGDAGIKNALAKVGKTFSIEDLKPWRSYATLQLWNQL